MQYRILFFGSFDEDIAFTGAGKVALEVFQRVKEHYKEVHFISYFQNGQIYSRYKKLFGKQPFVNNFAMYGIFPLLSYIIKKKPQIIQIIFPSAYYLPALLLAKLFDIKICYLVHQNFSYSLKNDSITNFEKRRILFIEKVSLFFSDTILVLSKFDKKLLAEQINVKKKKIFIVDNGINDSRFKKEYQTTNLKKIKIITVGSFDRKEKGLWLLINILKLLDIKIQLTICSSLKHKVFYNEKIPSNIKIIYKHSLNEKELREEFIKNDIFIAVSSYDTFNTALLEAMNSGLHFVATKEIGLTERFSEELLENVIPYGDINLSIQKINNLVKLLPTEKIILSKKIIDFSRYYIWERVINKYFKVYESLLNEL